MSKLYDKAAEAVKKRNYDYAIELFIQELTIEPNNIEARKALRAAELRKFQENGANAEGGARALLKGIGPLFSSVIHRITKNHEKLMLDFEQLLKNAPRNRGFLGGLGDAAYAAGHIDAAIVAYEELRDADKESEKALRGLGRLWREKGDLGRALIYYEQLKRAIPSDPEAAKAVRDLAASGATKRVEDAKAGAGADGTFRDLVKDKTEAEKLEHAQHKVRTSDEADAAIQRALADAQKKPEDAPRLLRQVGDLYRRKKDLDRAAEFYEKSFAAKKDPQVADLLGDVKLDQLEAEVAGLKEAAKKGDAAAKGKLKEAKERQTELQIEEYARRVKERPTELMLKFNLGQAFYKAERWDEAIGELQKAAGDPRRGAQARLSLGKCFAAKGMLDLAIKELEKARQGSTAMDDNTKEVTYYLAQILEKAGQKAKAASEYEKIIEVDIGYKDAMKRMEALKA